MKSLFCKLSGIVFTSLMLSQPGYSAELEINIDDVRHSKGDIWILVFDNASGFNRLDNQATSAMLKIPANKGQSKVKLYNIESGDYAISIMHDENGNGKEDKKNGYTAEGYGFSRNVGKKEMPSFSKAMIQVKGQSETHISLNYPEL